MEYNKLVRDKIPEIIESNNEEAIYRYLSDNEFKEYLKLKLSEELNDILSSKNNIRRSSRFTRSYKILFKSS